MLELIKRSIYLKCCFIDVQMLKVIIQPNKRRGQANRVVSVSFTIVGLNITFSMSTALATCGAAKDNEQPAPHGSPTFTGEGG